MCELAAERISDLQLSEKHLGGRKVYVDKKLNNGGETILN